MSEAPEPTPPSLRPSSASRRCGLAIGWAGRVIAAGLATALLLGASGPASATDPAGPATLPDADASALNIPGLTMRLADDDPAAGDHGRSLRASYAQPESADRQALWLDPEIAVTGDLVASATASDGPFWPVISVQFTPAGKSRLAEVSAQNIGRRLAILVDGKVLSAPVIVEQIAGGVASISGHKDMQEAERIAADISPKAPAP